jgi:dGTPase
MSRAKAVITDLFGAFSADPGLLPEDWGRICGSGTTGGVVRDYIAGMTDTYALAEYARVFHTKIEL